MLFWGNDRRTAIVKVRLTSNPDRVALDLGNICKARQKFSPSVESPTAMICLEHTSHVYMQGSQGYSLEADAVNGGFVSVPEAYLRLHGNINFRPCCRAWVAVFRSSDPTHGACP